MATVDSGRGRWCLGLKSHGFRDLQAHEIERLRGDAAAALRRLWQPAVIAAASPAALYASYLVHGNGPEPAGPRMFVFAVLAFAGLMALPAAFLLVARDVLKRWRALRADLEGRRVERFAPAESERGQVEVLPHSGLVFLHDGVPPRRPWRAEIYAAVTPPGSVALYALPADLAAGLPDEIHERAVVQRRRLTRAEVDELQYLVRRLRRPSWALIGFGVWCGMGLVGAIGSYVSGDLVGWKRHHLLALLTVTAVVIWRSVRYVRTILESRALARDAASGWVIVIEERGDAPARQEVLLESGAVWSVMGAPSSWRLRPDGRKPGS